MPDSTITLRTRSDLSALVAARNSFNVLTSDEQKAERAALALAQSMARLDASLKQPAEGAARLRQALQNAAYLDPRQAAGALNQIISLEQKAETETQKLAKAQSGLGTAGGLPILPRTLESFGTEALGQVKAGLLGVVGPAALVTAGFGAVKKAIDLTEESFKLKAALDTTNTSIRLQLQNFRDVNQTLQQGQQFAERYAITQEENATAIQASIPILRQSKASLTDVEGVLSRLAVLKPEQGIQGAAFALAELEGGQSRSLATRFNIPISKATEMKNEIQKGGDAVEILDKYLNSVGIDMSTLDTRTQGATGKMNQLKVETEKFQLALGGQAGGPGLALLNTRIALAAGGARLLSGQFDEFGRSVTASVAEGQTGLLSFLNILQPFAQQVQQKIDAAADASARLAEKNEIGAGAFNAASAAAISYASHVEAAGASALNSAADVDILNNALAGAAPENRHIGGVGNSTPGLAGLLGGGAGGLSARQDQANQALQDSRDALALSKAKTLAEKIAIYQRRLDQQTTEEGRNKYQTLINNLRNSGSGAAGGKGLGALDRVDISLAGDYQAQLDAVNRKLAAGHLTELQRKQLLKEQLDLQKKIADEQDRANNAALDAQIQAIENRKKDREDAQRLAAAQAVLRNPNAFSAEQRTNAQDLVELLPLEQQKRNRDQAAKAREAGIAPGAALATAVPVAPGAAQATTADAPPAPGAANTSGTPLIINMDGKQVAIVQLPYIVQGLQNLTTQVRAAGG